MAIDRAGVAEFLRRRREALQPEDVGLPRGARRRTEGLRREEVALLSHMSTDYYARLERGTGPQPVGADARVDRARAAPVDRRAQPPLPPCRPPTAGGRRVDRPRQPRDAAHPRPAPGHSGRDRDRARRDAATDAARRRAHGRHREPGRARAIHRVPLVHRPVEPRTVCGRGSRVPLAALGIGTARDLGPPRTAVPRSGTGGRPADRERGVPRSSGSGTRSGSGPGRSKHFRHPELGILELSCQTLVDPAQSHSLLVYTAVPGSESYREAAAALRHRDAADTGVARLAALVVSGRCDGSGQRAERSPAARAAGR